MAKNDNAFLAVDDVAALQAGADRLSRRLSAGNSLDADARPEVPQKGTQPDAFVAVLLDHAGSGSRAATAKRN